MTSIEEHRRDAWNHAASMVTASIHDDAVTLAGLFDTMPVGTAAALVRLTTTFLADLAAFRGVAVDDYWAAYAARLQTILDGGAPA